MLHRSLARGAPDARSGSQSAGVSGTAGIFDVMVGAACAQCAMNFVRASKKPDLCLALPAWPSSWPVGRLRTCIRAHYWSRLHSRRVVKSIRLRTRQVRLGLRHRLREPQEEWSGDADSVHDWRGVELREHSAPAGARIAAGRAHHLESVPSGLRTSVVMLCTRRSGRSADAARPSEQSCQHRRAITTGCEPRGRSPDVEVDRQAEGEAAAQVSGNARPPGQVELA